VTHTDIIGIKVKLARDCDSAKPCHDNVAVIGPGKAPHVGEFRCAACGAHRGWLSHAMNDFILETVRRFGSPVEPIILSQERKEKVMEYDNTNRGAIFRADKVKDTDRDYSGSLDVSGVQHWVSGYVKVSKAGKKYLALTIKPKAAPAPDKSKPLAEDPQRRNPCILANSVTGCSSGR
jgi:hypothetical protein